MSFGLQGGFKSLQGVAVVLQLAEHFFLVGVQNVAPHFGIGSGNPGEIFEPGAGQLQVIPRHAVAR